jgi:hypothetical protein
MPTSQQRGETAGKTGLVGGELIHTHQGQQQLRAEAIPLQLGQLGAAERLAAPMALQGYELGNQHFATPDPVGKTRASLS